MDVNNKKIYAFISGALSAIIFITLLIILADTYLPLKNFLAATLYHHWVAKGILGIFVFVISYFIFYLISYNINIDTPKIIKSLKYLFWVSLISILVLTSFFIYEAFLKNLK